MIGGEGERRVERGGKKGLKGERRVEVREEGSEKREERFIGERRVKERGKKCLK